MILESLVKQKRCFDVTNKKDMQSAKMFFSTHSWRHEDGCPFILEFPYLTVPDMIRDKMINSSFEIERVE